MSGDTLFRNATIGGFNKEDVMHYIELLKKSAVENEANLERAMKQLNELQRRTDVAENKLERETQKNEQLKKENDKLTERAETAEAKNAALTKRLSSFENSKSKLAAIEVQLGSLMVDAHMYADKIVETAKQEAKRISEETKQLVVQAKGEISDISADFVATSDEYGRLLNIINTKISDLPIQFDAISDSVKNDYESMDFAVDTLEDIPMPEFESADFEEEVSVEETPEEPTAEEEDVCEEIIEEEEIAEFEETEEPNSLDEILAGLDIALENELKEEEIPAEDKVELVEEEPFSMSAFFAGLDDLTADEKKNKEDPVAEESENQETVVENFDYTKFLDFLADDSSK